MSVRRSDTPGKSPIAVILGAATWPHHESLNNRAFGLSADAFKRYLIGGMGVATESLLDLFDSDASASDQIVHIGEFLEKHVDREPGTLLVYYVGHGQPVDDSYRLLIAATRSDYEASTSLSLSDLNETLSRFRPNFREALIVDACFAGAAVSTFRRPRSGLGLTVLAAASSADSPRARDEDRPTLFTEALVSALEEGDASRQEWLTLEDVLDLAREILEGVKGSVRPELHDPEQRRGKVSELPLFRNAAWPSHTRASQERGAGRPWSQVLSEADEDRHLLAVAAGEMAIKSGADLEDAFGWRLANDPAVVRAGKALSSARAFARAVRDSCLGDLAFFDLTGLEPAVVLFLGIRSVVRRGVTICSTAEDATQVNPPFHLREVRLASHHPDITSRPPEDVLAERAMAGLRDLRGVPQHYADLPAFDPLRAPAPAPQGPVPRTVEDGEALVLCSFAAEYTERNWRQLQRTISARLPSLMTRSSTARGRRRTPEVARSVDLRSPRIVTPALFESIRLTEFCVVDLTEWRPNVLFELGVRLAASPVLPIVILAQPINTATLTCQQQGLIDLFEPIGYDPDDAREAADAMLQRHLATRAGRLDSNVASLQRTHQRAYNAAWGLSETEVEPVAPTAVERLRDAARQLLVDQSTGVRPNIYPATHPLSDLSESNGVEHLVAAWLYLTHRTGLENANEMIRTQAVDVGSELVTRLAASDRPDDDDLAADIFAQLDKLRGRGDASMPIEDVLAHAMLLQQVAKAYTRRGHLSQATTHLQNAIALLRPHLDVQKIHRPWSGTTVRLAATLSDTYGQLGGVYRREERVEEALDAYRAGREIERDPAFGLINSYNSTNERVMEFLISPELSEGKRTGLLEALQWTRDQAAGPRREDWWVWADVGVLSVLAGDGEEAMSAYATFREVGARRADLDSARPVVDEIYAAASDVRQDVASAAQLALDFLDELRLRRKRTQH